MTITRPDAYRLLSVAPFDMVVFGGTGDLTRGETPPFLAGTAEARYRWFADSPLEGTGFEISL